MKIATNVRFCHLEHPFADKDEGLPALYVGFLTVTEAIRNTGKVGPFYIEYAQGFVHLAGHIDAEGDFTLEVAR